jgi:hypothetical protein
MSHDDGGSPAAGAAIHTMNIASTNPAGLNGDKHFAVTGGRSGNVFENEPFVVFEN